MRDLRPSRRVVVGGLSVLALFLFVGVFVSSERAGHLGSSESVASDGDERGSLLFAAKWVPLDRGDEVAVELLELDGWDIEIRQVTSPEHLEVDETAAFDVVVLSSSLDSRNITHLGATPVPVVTWEPYHHDDMGSFTRNGPSPQHLGFTVDGTHPLAAELGLDGEVAVASWAPTAAAGGDPVEGVVPIGVYPDGLIGWYELPAGAMLTDGTAAPACRVGLPFNDKASMMRGLTDQGADILTGSIRYAADGCQIAAAELGDLGDVVDLDEPEVVTTITEPTADEPGDADDGEPPAAEEPDEADDGEPPAAEEPGDADDGEPPAAEEPGDADDAPPAVTVPDPDPVPPTDTDSAPGQGAPERASVFVVDDDGRAELLAAAGQPISAAGGGGDGAVVAATAAGASWWTVTALGEVTAHGGGRHLGDLAGLPLNAPIVTALATPSGEGYWLVASDGGVFAFGDAAFFGSLGSLVLNAPIATGAFTSTGHGYWLVASDGGVFSFGDATFHGSEANSDRSWRLLAPHLDGSGYTLVATDGLTSVQGGSLEVPGDVVADGARAVAVIVLTAEAPSPE